MRQTLLFCFSLFWVNAFAQNIELHQIERSTSPLMQGFNFGVSFKEGQYAKNQSFTITNTSQQALPSQTWPMAYWPDGSLKWLGVSTVAAANIDKILLNASAAPKSVENNGVLKLFFPKKNAQNVVDSVQLKGKTIFKNLTFEAILQDKPDDYLENVQKSKLKCIVKNIITEQKGAVREVVKIEGSLQQNNEEILGFVLRFYVFSAIGQFKIVQSIIYNGNPDKHFIKGLGLVAQLPFREEIQNRHIKFGGEAEGVWSEPIQPLHGRRPLLHEQQPVYNEQVKGNRVPNRSQYSADGQLLIKDWATWNDFVLTQPSADGFNIRKRTHKAGAWVDANAGTRAGGAMFLGDVSGGISISLKNFWQSYPAALEVNNAAQNVATLKAWTWSPYGEAMDMRHYDTLATGHGLEASYEDVQSGFSTANGIARTSELNFMIHENVPSSDVFSQFSLISQKNNLFVTSSEYLKSTHVFGAWALPNNASIGKKWLENQLQKSIDFYKNEIENRRWYGFWNYGDVMHSYDPNRHVWRYDIGGFAWANTELAPDMWLWYSFLRTQKPDTYRMAEAMTRHTSEVDVYHAGRFRGLGSRHNVKHWGCGAKEVRISQAALKRFYYYLSTDERTGDLITEVANAEEAITTTDPLRLILPKSQYPTHARFGPDWLALASNWFTQWERTGDSRWKDKILVGVQSFSKMPYGFFSGKQGAFGFDPRSLKMERLTDKEDEIGSAHLTTIMGGAEVVFEIEPLLKDAQFSKLWEQYCRLYGATSDEIMAELGQKVKLGDMTPHYTRLMAYMAHKTKNEALAKKAWDIFLNTNRPSYHLFDPKTIAGSEVMRPTQEIRGVSTNNTAQWCLNAIELLDLIGEYFPEKHRNWE